MTTFPYRIPSAEMLRDFPRERFDRLPFGLIQLDEDGVILDINQTEAKRTGARLENLIGRNFFTDVAPCTDVREFAGTFREGARFGNLSKTFLYTYPLENGPVEVVVHLFAAVPGFGYVLATL